jgi:hypothetical protein
MGEMIMVLKGQIVSLDFSLILSIVLIIAILFSVLYLKTESSAIKQINATNLVSLSNLVIYFTPSNQIFGYYTQSSANFYNYNSITINFMTSSNDISLPFSANVYNQTTGSVVYISNVSMTANSINILKNESYTTKYFSFILDNQNYTVFEQLKGNLYIK